MEREIKMDRGSEMGRNEFFEKMRDLIEERLPESILAEGKVVISESRKNNDVIMHGIMISREGAGGTPVIYIDEAYDLYRQGRPADELADFAGKMFCKAWENKPCMELPVLEYEDIKDRIFYRIAEVKRNRGRLSDMKYSLAECGFAKVYNIAISKEASIPITNSLAEEYGYDPDKLFEAAERNTPELYPAVFEDLQDIVMNIGQPEDPELTLLSERESFGENSGMFFLSSRDMTNGAATIFYPDVKEKIAEVIDDSYYVLPSSIHELMVVPCKSGIAPEYLQNTVREANEHMCSDAEILSDRVMKYDRDTKELKIVKEERSKDQERGR